MDDHQQFLGERNERIHRFQAETKLKDSASVFLEQTLRHEYSYNFEWMGLPVIQYPQDLIALQEIIWQTKPDLIIETGVARGGSLVFYASMLSQLGGDRKVLGIDVDLREHNKKRLLAHPLSEWIQLLDGSSTDSETYVLVKNLTQQYKSVMVCLDSNHTSEHVLQELNLYGALVTSGNYCVVFDTIIEKMPAGFYQNRPWDKGNSPETAIQQYLAENCEFEIDQEMDAKLLISAALGGYLKKNN